MERKFLPVTYFEKISRFIRLRIPDFFASTERDFKQDVDKLDAIPTKNQYQKLPKQKQKDEIELLHFLSDNDGVETEAYRNVMKCFEECPEEFFNTPINDIAKLDEELAQKLCNFLYLARGIATMEGQINDGQNIVRNLKSNLLKNTHAFNLLGKKIFRVEEQLNDELFLTDVYLMRYSNYKQIYLKMVI